METRILIPEQLRLLLNDKNIAHPKSSSFSSTQSKNNEKSSSPSSVSRNEVVDSGLDENCVVLRSSRRRKSNVQTRARKFERSLSDSSSNSEQGHEPSSSESESEPEVNDDSDPDAPESEQSEVRIRTTSKSRSRTQDSGKSINSTSNLNQASCDSIVKICARERISKGTRLSPGDGRIKVLLLDGLATISEDDVRCVFGCFDRLMEDPAKQGKKIRLCSWLKFVTRSADSNSSENLIAKFVDRKPVLEFSQDLGAGDEVVAFFDLDSVNRNIDAESSNYLQRMKEEMKMTRASLPWADSINSREGPLDLSNCKSPSSHKSSRSPVESPEALSTTAINMRPSKEKEYANSRSSTPASSHSSSTISNEGQDMRRKGSTPKKRVQNSARSSGIFSIHDVLQLQSSSSSTSAFLQPHMYNFNNSHPEQLMLTPPLSSSTTHATTTALSSPSDSNRSVLSSPSSNPKLSPHDFDPVANRHKLTHTNLHNMLTHYGFNAGIGMSMGPGSSAAGAGAPSLLRPILRTRGRERSLLPCEVCNKAFDRPSLLKRHMRTHTGEKPHVCDTCGKGFSTSSSLNTHRRIHSGEKPHQCPICGKRFTASSNLYYHRMTHNKEKPHKCLLCGKSFPTPGDLKSHQYVHSGSWPFSCRICNRGFSKQTNLRNHLLLHSGDKPHACRICNKKFALACNLRAHLRTHEEDALSTCLSCKRSFVNSLNMVVNGQCRVCTSKLHGSMLPSQFLPIPRTEASGDRASVETFQSAGTLTSNITIPQPPSSTSSVTISRKRSASPESRKESHRKPLLHPIGSAIPPLHRIQHQYYPLHHLQQPGGSASTSLAAIATGHQFPYPLLNNLHAQQLPFGTNFTERPNPFLEQLFEWNLRVANETVGNLGLMQQKLLESQMLAAHLMTSPAGLSDLLRLQAGANPANLGRGAPALLSSSNDFKNVSGGARLEILEDKK